MSLLFLSDLHLDQYRPFSSILPNGMNSRLLEQLNVVKDVGAIIEMESPEAVFFLGDLFNGITESLPKIIYNAGFLTAKAWSKICPLYIIVGNHDIYRGMHCFSAFESLPNCHIISTTTKVNIDDYEIDCIPWDNPIPKERGQICAGHLEVYGSMMNATYACKQGIPPTNFFVYQFVLLGHFHTPQYLPVPGLMEGYARYIGSLMQMDQRRSSEGFTGLIKLDDYALTEIPIVSPRIYDVSINNKEDLDGFTERLQRERSSLEYDRQGKLFNYFKVFITDPSLNLEISDNRISVEYNLPEVITSRLGMEDTTLSDFTTKTKLQEAVEKWIDNANTKTNKEKAKALAKELL